MRICIEMASHGQPLGPEDRNRLYPDQVKRIGSQNAPEEFLHEERQHEHEAQKDYGWSCVEQLFAQDAVTQLDGYPDLSNIYPHPCLIPDSPDEMVFGQLRASISVVRSSSYTG